MDILCDPTNYVRFALSLTVSEISANLCFLTNFKNFEILEMLKNVTNFNSSALSLTVSKF